MATVRELVEEARRDGVGDWEDDVSMVVLQTLGLWDAEVLEATFDDADGEMGFMAPDGTDVIYNMYLKGALRSGHPVKVIVIPQEKNDEC